MKLLRLLPQLLVVLFAVSGCSKPAPDPVAKILAKKPAFLRICNLSEATFTTKLNGAAFGPEFTPGTSTSLSRIPVGTAQLQIVSGGATTAPVEIPARAGEGSTLFVLDPGKSDGFAIVAGDVYEAPAGEARMRAVSVGALKSGTILRNGESWHAIAETPSGGEVAPAEIGQPVELTLADASGKALAKATLTPESSRSYTIVARSAAGKPVLEVLVNNPPLSPRGRQGMMGSS